jgi:RimJ/RimL family protein N-acetyltransferase
LIVRASAPVVLEGPDVRLEPLGAEHAAGLELAVEADPTVFVLSGPADPGGLSAWLANARAEQAAGTRVPFAVIERSSGAVVGSTSYLDLVPELDRIEIGATWYGRPWWATRVNPATKLLLLVHAFDELGARRVALRTDAVNARSRRAIERLGARHEGVLRAWERRPSGEPRDTAFYSILADEWPGVRAGLEARLGS